ncbi:MAG: cytochrome c [Gammaproteobacteria bacterium]
MRSNISRIPMAFAALILCVASSTSSYAAGDADAGKARAAVCMACHGMDGNSANPEWPTLAGQHEDYIVTQLTAFQEGKRKNVLMSPMSMGLTDTDKANLAAFYSSQTTKTTPVDPALVDQGRKLYLAGDSERGIAACASCHGPTGRGNGPAGMPVLSGQRSTYTVNQLKAYADGTRVAASEVKTSMMHEIAKSLTAEDMVAVANFVQGLK